MGCVCYTDTGPAAFYYDTRPLARKEHKCTECRRVIKKGERYENVRGKWDDGVATIKTCVCCLAIRDLMEARLGCFCWAHGTLWDGIYEALDYVEAPGLRMAVGRIVVERNRGIQ